MKDRDKISSVVNSIISMIEKKQIAENERFPAEEIISKKLGVNRTTLREAYRIIEAKGYIRRIPNRGVFLVSINPESQNTDSMKWFVEHKFELEEIFKVRLVLEKLMAEEVAEKGNLKNIEKKLASNISRFNGNGFDKKKLLFYTQLDEEFHGILFEACGNELLNSIYKNVMVPVLKPSRSKSFCLEINWKSALNAHKKILLGVMKNNPLLVKNSLEDHIRQTRALWYL